MWLFTRLLTPTLFFLVGWADLLPAEQEPSPSPAARWDQRYSAEHYIYGKEPVVFLREHVGDLGKGRALCLAAGEGCNAVYLARQGFEVVAVDFSEKGLEKCRELAREHGVEVQTVVADLREYDMGRERYDLITDFYYYQPDLFPRVMAALKPGGVFILQNFSVDQPATSRFGPRHPAYLIRPNQLLQYFAQHRIRYYEDTVVDLDEGMHRGPGAVIRLIAEKSRVDEP